MNHKMNNLLISLNNNGDFSKLSKKLKSRMLDVSNASTQLNSSQVVYYIVHCFKIG